MIAAGRHALVAGATGIVGRRIAECLAASGWQVTGLCRRPPPVALPYQVLAVDLTDSADCRRKLGDVDATHLIYAARYDHPEGASESVDLNTAMLVNLMDAVEPAAPSLRHIHLVHGTKYYGHMLGPVPVPLAEEHPRAAGRNFYFTHEDFIRERQGGARWTFSTSRPHSFIDSNADEPRNLALLIALHASIARALDQPFDYPGTETSFRSRTQFTHVPLLARAIRWMADEPRCANQSYHVVNGDSPRWSELWPRFADYFGVEKGVPREMSLARYMADKETVWHALGQRRGLKPTKLSLLVLWPYAQYVFSPEWDIISGMSKARRDGFNEAIDSAQMFLDIFDSFRADKIIP